ncbi:MAG: FAD-dependent oxidoreductase, partial [Desulfobacterales bacterium]|nr:FAD-dependent oxidoreductase [Desulfobacterales bacterium]
RVAVIGGGPVAVDVSRTVLRLGADEVNAYEMLPREQMPVTDAEYDEAMAEGMQVNFLVSPTRIVSDNWKVVGLYCVHRRLGEPDASGRRRPIPIPGSEFFVEVDTVIAAVGQAPDLSFLPPDSALERTRLERLVVDENRLATNLPGVFAGGDFVAGPGKVIEGIAAGRRAAIAIDKYLRGDTSRVEIYDLKPSFIEEEISKEEEETWEPQLRPEMSRLPFQERKRSFKETELGFSEEKAKQESKRCLRCDLER